MKTPNDHPSSRRLVYAFIPYYRCLYDVNLNFDQNFIIDYKPDTRIISIKMNDSYPKDFWPDNISSVSVIAGKNGAGKSSVLRWLLEKTLPYTQKASSESFFNRIITIVEGRKLMIYHGIPGLKQEENKLSERKLDIQLINVSGWTPQRLSDEMALTSIYYSGHFDSNIGAPDFDDDEEILWNISDIYTLQKDSDVFASRYLASNKIKEVEYLRYYHLCNDLRICKLLLDRRFQNTFSIEGRPALRLPRYIVIIRDASVKPLLERRIQNLSDTTKSQFGISNTTTKKEQKTLDLLKKISKVPLNPTMQEVAEFEGKQGFDEYLYYALQNFCFQVIEDDTSEYALKYTLTNLFDVDYRDAEDTIVDWAKKVRNIFRERIIKQKTKLSQESLIFADDFFDALEEAICFLDKLKWKDGKAFIDCVSIVKDPDFTPPKGAQIYAEFFPPAYTRLHDVISSIERFSFITYSLMILASEIDTLVKETEERPDEGNNMNGEGILLDGNRIQNLRARIDMIGDERIKNYLHSRLNKVDPNEEIRYLKERLAFLEARHNNPHEKD